MTVEQQNNELLIRLSLGNKASKIQSILDYLRFEELSSKSKATKKDVENLINKAKSNRWEKIRKEIGLND